MQLPVNPINPCSTVVGACSCGTAFDGAVYRAGRIEGEAMVRVGSWLAASCLALALSIGSAFAQSGKTMRIVVPVPPPAMDRAPLPLSPVETAKIGAVRVHLAHARTSRLAEAFNPE
jgi:hypothetical protein